MRKEGDSIGLQVLREPRDSEGRQQVGEGGWRGFRVAELKGKPLRGSSEELYSRENCGVGERLEQRKCHLSPERGYVGCWKESSLCSRGLQGTGHKGIKGTFLGL